MAKFFFEGDLRPNLEAFPRKIKSAIGLSGSKIAVDGQGWMRSNAPWTDRTGNARNGLVGVYESSANGGRVVFAHSVNYGIWLEVRWSGRYAIILPAVEEFANRWGKLLSRMIFAVK